MVQLRAYDRPGAWLSGTGPESDIVISSRIRLARNVEGFPFVNKMDDGLRQELVSLLLKRLDPVITAQGLEWIDISDLDGIDLNLLFERHLISNEIVGSHGRRGVLVNEQETIAVMVNEEDHLRIQYLESGLQLGRVWNDIDQLDNAIGEAAGYVFHEEFGFLTSCPTNAGTGIRVSVMLHLPGLAITNQVHKVFNAVSKLGLTVRGLFGEGTDGIGDFYQISNQVTLGQSESDVISKVGSIIPKVISYERRAREQLFKDRKTIVEDRIWRAYGILKHACSLSSDETLTLLSLLRLGISLGVVTDLDVDAVNSLFINSQPSHLQKIEKREMEPSERDSVRAVYLKQALNN